MNNIVIFNLSIGNNNNNNIKQTISFLLTIKFSKMLNNNTVQYYFNLFIEID